IDLALDAQRHAADPVDAGDRGAAEFLYNARHLSNLRRLTILMMIKTRMGRPSPALVAGERARIHTLPPDGEARTAALSGDGMSGAGLAIPAAVLAVFSAAANPDSAALTQLGLAGDWAIDCRQAISDANPHVTFAAPGDQIPEYIERGPNGAAGTAAISNV